MKNVLALVLFASFAAVAPAGEKAWSRFRGPNGSGVAEGQKPPVGFGPDKNVKWKIAVPPGISSPIVAGDLLVLTAFDDGKLFTIAYDRKDGAERWRREAVVKKLEAFHKTESSPAASTPVSDGKRIVSYFGSCGLVCYDLAGKELWRLELPTADSFGKFGSGVSPIIVNGAVILQRDLVKDAKIMAVDLASGDVKWEKKRMSPVSYGTPVVWATPLGSQVVASGHARLIAYDLETGAEKWFVTGMPSGCCSSPIVAEGMLLFAGYSPGGDKEFKMPSFDDLLKFMDKDKDGAISREETKGTELEPFFDAQDRNGDGKITRDEWEANLKFMADGKNSAFAVKAGGAGDITKSHILWQKTKGTPYVPSAIAYRGQLVMIKDKGLVTAYDIKTGKEIYNERAADPGRYYASPVAANGHIYFTSLDDGTVTVLKAGTDKAEVAAKNAKLGERVSATPAIADNTIYIRGARHLYAFAEKK